MWGSGSAFLDYAILRLECWRGLDPDIPVLHPFLGLRDRSHRRGKMLMMDCLLLFRIELAVGNLLEVIAPEGAGVP